MPSDATYEEYMAMCFPMIDMCDAIFMLDGWRDSRGANREYGYALGKDKIIMIQRTEQRANSENA